MGKKPLAAIIGLVWAGIALTGCGKCSQNCRNGSCGSSSPACASRPAGPVGGVPPAPVLVGDAKPPMPTMPASKSDILTSQPTGAASPSPVQPISGTTTALPATPTPAGGPTTQNSLSSPASDTGPLSSNSPSPRMDDGLGATPGAAGVAAPSDVRRVPPMPVRSMTTDTTSSQMPSRPAEPALGQPLPPVNAPAPMPMPAAPAPVPSASESLPPMIGGGSSLPPLPN